MGVGVHGHHRKPKDRNHRQECSRSKHHAGVSRCCQEFADAMVAERETEQVNGCKDSCQVKNRCYKPETQKSLVVAAVVAHGLEFHMNGVVHLLGEHIRANGRNHRADFLDGKGVGQIILPAGVHRDHRRFQTEGTAFHVVWQYEKSLQLSADYGMFAFASVFAIHCHMKYGICAERHFNFVGQERTVLF